MLSQGRLSPSALLAGALLVAVLVALPVVSVLTNIFWGGTSETWRHLVETVLLDYVGNTLWLAMGVGLGTMVVGTATAWLIAMHRFPGRRFFQWALILPLAMPAYVMAYLYTDLLQFVGPVQTTLREMFAWSRGDYWFPDVRSLGGAVTMFILVLYPYVYLLARVAFLERSSGMIEAGRTLGLGPWSCFVRVSLPLARPAIAAGVALALMETLADYGTVSYFAVPTFTTGIYRAWFSLGDHVAAAQLSSLLLGFVLLLVVVERFSRGRARYHNTTQRNRPHSGRELRGGKAWGATLICLIPLFLGFILPAGLLLRLAWREGDDEFGPRFLQLAGNSATLAATASCLAVVLAVWLAYTQRLAQAGQGGGGGWLGLGRWSARLARATNRFVSLGYAVPGTIIAVGVLIPVTHLDHLLAGLIESATGNRPGLILTGGIAALVYAYLARFLSIALQTVSESLAKITRGMDDAARSLGLGEAGVLGKVHIPLLRSSLWTAGLLVFVDVMKELPATLVMRPFDFDTLATQVYTLAADERLSEASTAALAIVAVGLIPLLILSRQIVRSVRS